MVFSLTESSDAPVMETRSIIWDGGRLHLTLELPTDAAPYLRGVRVDGGPSLEMPAGLPLADALLLSVGHTPASNRLVHGSIGDALRYVEHELQTDDAGETLLVHCTGGVAGLRLVVSYFVARGTAVVRATTRLVNTDLDAEFIVRVVPSWSAYLGHAVGQAPAPRSWELVSGTNDWLAEGRWERRALDGHLLPDLAASLTGHNPRGSVSVTSDGTWSTGANLPVGVLSSETFGAAWAWQIEHNGAWRWELGEDEADVYLALSGPTDIDHQFTRVLRAGESFESVPVAVALGTDFESAVGELTSYRRTIRREHPDNAAMPVIYNDYMNTLNGDPSTELLLPLIAAAAEIGAEIFCIDAGWYDDGGDWWNSVGDWTPSEVRFPGGFEEVVDAIAAAGMVVGLWLEPEVVGVHSPAAERLPRDAFLSRHGQRIVEHERYLLDLRHPAARAHLDEVVDRLVGRFGVGYFKLDYNVTPGAGPDGYADSVGSGLLAVNRAHLAWLDAVLDRHPGLVLENCASGAMRSDFAILSRLQLQSTSDQQDPLLYPPIVVSAPLMMLPEQAASWAYPQPEMGEEEAAFALVTGLLGRFFVSGYLNRMSVEQLAVVTEAVALAKELRTHIAAAAPSWPLGLPGWDDPVVSLGLHADARTVVGVWDRSGSSTAQLHLPQFENQTIAVDTLFPSTLSDWEHHWDPRTALLSITNAANGPAARLIAIGRAPA